LYQETEGLPYFVIEYLAAFSGPDREPELEETTANDWPMPGSVRDLLQNRLNLVSQTGQQLLQTAAAVGRTFDDELLRLASGRSEEETVTVLDELSGRGLLVERKIEPKESASLTSRRSLFDFSHNKLRDLVYEETSLVRRRLLHRRLAEVLAAEARRNPQPAAVAGQIAGHYQLAGREREAAAAFQQAGDYAHSLYANQEALAHYQAALALGNPETSTLHEACGDLQTLLGNYRQALNSYETAAAQAGQQNLGRLEHKLGQVYRRQGEWQAARQQLKRALASYGPDGPPDALAAVYIDWSFVAYRQGEQKQALEQAEQALSLAQKCTNSFILAQTHNILGILARWRGELAEAVRQLEQSRHLAEASGQLEAQVAALNNLALTEHAAGRPERALQMLKTAVQLCVTYGDRHREAALYNNLADLLYALGQDEEAMVHLKQSVTIYAELGRVQGEWQPEIWKMTEW
jgi:tetratricopeptide (TPR) repeat protein